MGKTLLQEVEQGKKCQRGEGARQMDRVEGITGGRGRGAGAGGEGDCQVTEINDRLMNTLLLLGDSCTVTPIDIISVPQGGVRSKIFRFPKCPDPSHVTGCPRLPQRLCIPLSPIRVFSKSRPFWCDSVQ